MLSITDY